MSKDKAPFSVFRSVTVEGITMYANPRNCGHANDDACATCDFDSYYATRFKEACPWYKGWEFHPDV